MKTSIKTFIASTLTAVVLVSSALTTKANEEAPVEKNYQSVINSFMTSYTRNDASLMKSTLSKDASYKYIRESKVINHSAQELLAFVKKNDGMVYQDCKTDYQVLSNGDAMIQAKINISNGLNASTQYITLENNGKGDWKITQIYQVYAPTVSKGALARK